MQSMMSYRVAVSRRVDGKAFLVEQANRGSPSPSVSKNAAGQLQASDKLDSCGKLGHAEADGGKGGGKGHAEGAKGERGGVQRRKRRRCEREPPATRCDAACDGVYDAQTVEHHDPKVGAEDTHVAAVHRRQRRVGPDHPGLDNGERRRCAREERELDGARRAEDAAKQRHAEDANERGGYRAAQDGEGVLEQELAAGVEAEGEGNDGRLQPEEHVIPRRTHRPARHEVLLQRWEEALSARSPKEAKDGYGPAEGNEEGM